MINRSFQNNRLVQLISHHYYSSRSGFLYYYLIILISISFQFCYWRFYIYLLYHIQILAQSVHYSSKNVFPDYWLLILISICFQFCCWKRRERKILEKSQIIVTHTHCIIYKFQVNPFIIAQEMDFLIISSLFSFLYLSSKNAGKIKEYYYVHTRYRI